MLSYIRGFNKLIKTINKWTLSIVFSVVFITLFAMSYNITYVNTAIGYTSKLLNSSGEQYVQLAEQPRRGCNIDYIRTTSHVATLCLSYAYTLHVNHI